MADAKTNLIIEGVDRTGGAFASVASHAASAGAKLKGVLGGALAAAGAYLGFQSVKSGINELGHLSDISLKANTSVDELTKTATALDVLGIQNMGVDQFAKAMDYMQKTTGRVGMEGFYQTIEELGKIEDRAKRGQEAMKIFGRTGMEFMPLINGAEQGSEALRQVVDVMPSISQSAAVAGDNVADAMTIATTGVKSIWLQALGAICGWFDSQFVGGIQQAALMACAWLEYYAKLAASRVSYHFGQMQNAMSEIGGGIGAFIGALSEGASISEAWEMAKSDYTNSRNANLELENQEKESLERRQQAWREAYEERQRKIEFFAENVNKAATSAVPSSPLEDAAEAKATAKKAPAVRNTLLMGASNEARRLSILGPQLQSETKKQTALLKKIADNTGKKKEEDGDVLEVKELD